MEKIYAKIEKYLMREFPKKKIVLRSDMADDIYGAELYGIHSMKVLVVEEPNRLFYKLLK